VFVGCPVQFRLKFPISRDPPEGGTSNTPLSQTRWQKFPISRDPPEGGTMRIKLLGPWRFYKFPISRDPPEGGTRSEE